MSALSSVDRLSHSSTPDGVGGITIKGQKLWVHAHEVATQGTRAFKGIHHKMRRMMITSTSDCPAAVHDLINSYYMPYLEELSIDGRPKANVLHAASQVNVNDAAPNDQEQGLISSLGTFYLAAGMLPALRILLLLDAHAPLTCTLLSTLRHLVLYASPRSSRPLSLQEFCSILVDSEGGCIEKIDVYNYIDTATPDSLSSIEPVVLNRRSYPRMRSLKIHDKPPNVSTILSRVDVPDHVDVRASPDVSGLAPHEAASVFRKMLPDNFNLLPAFSHPDTIIACDSSVHGYSFEVLAQDHGVQFALDTDPAILTVGTHAVSLLKRVFALVPLLGRHTVTTLVFKGRLADVNEVTWVDMLSNLPNVSTLEFESVLPPPGCDDEKAVLDALACRSGKDPLVRPVCPALKRLTLRSQIEAAGLVLFLYIKNCCVHRVSHGAIHLSTLLLDLVRCSETSRSTKNVSKWKHLVSGLAETVTIAVGGVPMVEMRGLDSEHDT
ncbi:hypothetical protein C8Q79DRAFT_634382 [Trametes meyenii]|nr:hypothetical protein C8Q79DRAFT_634382 [Trametes meyenii]